MGMALPKNTLQQDRQYLFSADLGLYRGETSFLDWREQSYPAWTAKDTVFLAESFALSTNVLHYVALQRAATAAQTLEPAMATEFRLWAEALKTAINKSFLVSGTRFICQLPRPGTTFHKPSPNLIY